MKRVILTYVFVLLGLQLVIAQDKSLMLADTYFDNRDYVHAIKYYKKALRKSDNFQVQKDIAYHIAMSYYNMNDYNGALDWFEDAAGDTADNYDLYLKYSEALAIEGRFNEAITILQKIEATSTDSIFIKQRIAGIRLVTMQSQLDTLGLVRPEEQLNTEYSDYGLAAIWDNKFIVSSARKEGFTARVDGRTGQGFSNLFTTRNDEGSWTVLRKISGKFNSNENEGSFSYDSIHQIAYWTRCTEKSDLCLIYLSHFNSIKNTWTKPEKASFQISGYDYGHPFVSTNGQTLFFTSNMPDGHGGKDIWKISRKNDGNWGIPVNLGSGVNTVGNEAFPSIFGDSLLFFSSDHHKGLGRFDIFFSLKEGLHFTNSANLGYPINSAADDYGILLNNSGKNGWFCSDRNLETSDDIYSFKGFPIKIVVTGKVLHELDNTPIINATILFTDDDDNTDSILTKKDGEFLLYLNAFDEYRISAAKSKFYTDHKTVNTSSKEVLFSPPPQKEINFYLSRTQYPCAVRGLITNKETNNPMENIKVDIYTTNGFSTYTRSDIYGVYQFDGLKPKTIYTVRTSNDGYFTESRVCKLPKVNKSSVFWKGNGYDMDFELMKIQIRTEIILSNIYYDFNKSSLRETSKIELNKLSSMLLETPKVIVQIIAHTDEIGSASYNLKLSEKRAQSVVDYLIIKGVSKNRLIAKGYGESQLIIKNAQTDEQHQANRRTTFEVVEILGSSSDENIEAETAIQPTKISQNKHELIYRVQIATTSKPKSSESSFSNIRNNISGIVIIENKIDSVYKYEVGDHYSFKEAKKLQTRLKNLGYRDCFITSYNEGQKIPVSQAVKLENNLD